MEKENAMKKLTFTISLVLILALTGCNLPNSSGQETPQSPDAVFTQAALTVAAELTRVVSLATSTPMVPTDTFAPTPTNTPIPSATVTSIPCNMATWDPATIDVTIPDNTQMAPNQMFSKTWRIRNIGSCSWNSSYLLIFDHGDGMGVTSGYTQQLTSGIVNPGQWVDLTVNLKAPATNGTYTGYWRLRDPGGALFGITSSGGTFAVKIVVVTLNTLTLSPNAPGTESGTIRADAGPFPDFTAGESNADITQTCQAFLSYDISTIPTNATITEVKTDFSAYSTIGNPFGSLGVLNAYVTNYGATLEPADFVSGFPPGNIADWGSSAALNNIEASPELKAYLQSHLGTSRLQLRLQFGGSNGDAVKDRITFTNPKLIISYITP
jgi:hypothetical protein